MNLVNFLLFLGLGAKKPSGPYSQLDDQWTEFKCRFEKHYRDPSEEAIRRTHWQHNSKFIAEHNRHADQGLHSFRLAENFFADWSADERMNLKRMRALEADESPQADYLHLLENRQSQSDVDYRHTKCLVPIKHQGDCGSCWVFAATVPLEFQRCMRTNDAVAFSEQQLMDCAESYDLHGDGCPYGTYVDAWKFVKESGGISSADEYPYHAKKGQCKKTSERYAAVRSWIVLPKRDAPLMAAAVSVVGPVSISLIADGPEFDFYSSGVYQVANCSGQLNHGGSIVGFGTSDDGHDYWIFRNAWGPSWGLNGYMLLKRGANLCLVEQYPAFPLIH